MPGQTQFASTDVLIVADDHVVEVFHRSYMRSFRMATAWLGVQTKPKKDEVVIKFGWADPPEQPIYGEDVRATGVLVEFRIPAEDEPQLRAFFADAAARAGRMA